MKLVIPVAFISLIFTQGLQARPINEYSYNAWRIGAYADDNSNVFTHCAMSADYRSGITLLFSIDSNFVWSMGLYNPNWRLGTGSEYRFNISVDNVTGRNWVGYAISENVFKIPMPDSKDVFRLLQYGNILKINTGTQNLSFHLKDTRGALAETLRCVHTNKNIQASTPNPFVSSPTGKQDNNKTVVSDNSVEALETLINILSHLNIDGFRIIPTEEVKSRYEGVDAAWMSDKLMGLLLVLANPSDPQLGNMADELVAAEAKLCKGRFASARYEELENNLGVRVMTACETSNVTKVVHYNVVSRRKGGYYVFSVFRNPNFTDETQDIESYAMLASQNLFRVASNLN